MKKSSIAAVILGMASLGTSAAMAQTIVTTPQALDLTNNSAYFGDTFGPGNSGGTFADQFTFTVAGTTGWTLDAIVASITRTDATGLAITGVSLYDASDTLLTSGTSWLSGPIDLWSNSANNLSAGDYYLQVNGTVVSDGAASFGGAVSLAAPVPEPATYGMLLAGFGALGVLARRRKSANPA